MNIYHIWNTAGVGSLIAEYTARYYNVNPHVTYMKKFDPFNLSSNSKYTLMYDDNYKLYHLDQIKTALKNWSLFHVHSLHRYMLLLKFIKPGTPRVLHYHGTRIRGQWNKNKKWWTHANRIVVSTPDLLEGAPEDAIYIPNTYDDRIFYHDLNQIKLEGKALTVSHEADSEAQELANQYGLELDIHNRAENPLSHTEFAELIKRYSYYIDIKRQLPPNRAEILPALSLTGIEALAAGCKVINYEGKEISQIPERFKPENVAREWMKTYMELL